MPAAKSAPATKRSPAPRTRRGTVALDGLEVSLGEAQKALTDLQRDLSTGGRRLVKDVDTAVRNAQRDLRRSRKAIEDDLGDLGEALKPRRTGAKTTASRKTPQKSTATKS